MASLTGEILGKLNEPELITFLLNLQNKIEFLNTQGSEANLRLLYHK